MVQLGKRPTLAQVMILMFIWVQASRQAGQLGTWSLLQILSPSLCPPLLTLCLSLKNKIKYKKKIFKSNMCTYMYIYKIHFKLLNIPLCDLAPTFLFAVDLWSTFQFFESASLSHMLFLGASKGGIFFSFLTLLNGTSSERSFLTTLMTIAFSQYSIIILVYFFNSTCLHL